MYLTLRQLQIFDAVVHQRSFTRAASALHLTQPAVSMQMRQLEEQIGVPLFDYVGKQIKPTDAGRELHRHVTLIGARMRDLESAMEEFRGIDRGELDLTVASTANYFMPKLIAAFCARHAKVQVRLQVSNQTHILETLSASNNDLAIMGQPAENAELVARDKTSLDLFWLKDDSLADLDNLPEPTDLAEDIIENIEAGLASFRAVSAALGT